MTEAAPLLQATFRGRLGRFDLDVAFTAPARGVTALFGPSGCGKTTVLRCIAGLHRVAEGHCAVSEEVWQDAQTFRQPYQRPIGYVFQEASLFPHLSVKGNLLFGARPKAPQPNATGFSDVTALLGLTALLDRSPRHLSGGERQRVAIGRALLSNPRLLLMDEPLSALDRGTKDAIIPFLERLHDTLAIPTLYVSHDMSEVERLADHLVLLQNGRVIAAGPLRDLQSDPALPLAIARDAAVSLMATVTSYDETYGLAAFAVAGGTFVVPTSPLRVGESRRLRVASTDVSLTRLRPEQTSILNVVQARLLHATSIGTQEITIVLGLGRDGRGDRLLARITRRSWDLLGLAENLDVYAQIKGVALIRATP